MTLAKVVPIRQTEPPTARPWSVVHLCERTHALRTTIEGQLAVGMRPCLLTTSGAYSAESYLLRPPVDGARQMSLLRSWQDVRQWRKGLLDLDPRGEADIIHAHSFSTGMAAVRTYGGVVYDISDFIEQQADEHQQWLGRSLRVAEQFVIARAGAVVVHRPRQRADVLARGGEPAGVFVVPEPVRESDVASLPDYGWLRSLRLAASDAVWFVVPDAAPAEVPSLLQSFLAVWREVPQARMLLVAEEDNEAALLNQIVEAGLTNAVQTISVHERDVALTSADVVVATAATATATSVAAMAAGRALLAADVPTHRDATPDGRGAVWFRADDAKDLVARAAFLARNGDFRRALGEHGRLFVAETRLPEVVAHALDRVYQYAHAKRRAGGGPQQFFKLQPNLACL